MARAVRVSIRLMERLFIFALLTPAPAKSEPNRTSKTFFYRDGQDIQDKIKIVLR